MKFSHPPHLYCVTTTPSKTNTTVNIGVKCLDFSRNVMLSVGVSRIGKTRVFFIDPSSSSYYCNIVLEKGLLPDIRPIFRHYKWTLQQDGAPALIARTTMDHLKKSTSTSLNLTYGLQIALILNLQQRVYHQRQFKTVEKLKRAIVTKWQKLSQHFIDNSINEWRRRLEAVIKNGGGHIEHCNLA